MQPAPAQPAMTERYQYANSYKIRIPMLRVCFLLHECANAGAPAMDEVDEVLFHAVKARRQAFVFNAIEVELMDGSLPGYCVATVV